MLAIINSWKDATETNNFCFESKLTTNSCGKHHQEFYQTWTYFVAAQSNYKS